MNQKLCVYTCITGDYDELHEIEHPEKSIDYYCFTNNKNLKSKTWQIIPIENGNLNNHYLSRKIKMLGHPIISESYDTSVWMDASVIWDKNITEFVDAYLKTSSFAAFKHHARNTVRDEAIACLTLRKDDKDKILRTLDFLSAEHFPDDLGLYEMTVFIKKHNDPKVIKTMQAWFDTIKKYSRRDQLSFMYAVWKTGLKIDAINLDVWHNTWFHTTKHTPSHIVKDCHIYYGNPTQDFNFDKYYIYTYKITNSLYQISTTIPNDTDQIELSLSEVIGSSFKNLTIRPTPSSIEFSGFATQDQEKIFCTSHSVINLYGHFKKGQKFSLSVDLNPPSPATINKLIESEWTENNSLTHLNASLQDQINDLQSTNARLQSDINNILNSRSWKTIQALRKLLPRS